MIDLVTTNDTSENEDNLYILTNERILIGIFGAMRSNDEPTQGYFLVKWIIEPYSVQENTIMWGLNHNKSVLREKLYVMMCFEIQFPIQ